VTVDDVPLGGVATPDLGAASMPGAWLTRRGAK
jgi:hypothetical protein